MGTHLRAEGIQREPEWGSPTPQVRSIYCPDRNYVRKDNGNRNNRNEGCTNKGTQTKERNSDRSARNERTSAREVIGLGYIHDRRYSVGTSGFRSVPKCPGHRNPLELTGTRGNARERDGKEGDSGRSPYKHDQYFWWSQVTTCCDTVIL